MAVTLNRTLSAERQRLKIHVKTTTAATTKTNAHATSLRACREGLWMDISITTVAQPLRRTLSRAMGDSISLRLSNLLIIVAVVHVGEHTLPVSAGGNKNERTTLFGAAAAGYIFPNGPQVVVKHP